MRQIRHQNGRTGVKLYFCEKPSQGKDLAKVLGATKSGTGCLHDGNGVFVTWAIGHLLEEAEPQDYDPAQKKWSLEKLPIVPDKWKLNVSYRQAKQFKAIKELASKATEIIIATDYDREGEAIARSVLDRINFKGGIKRIKLRALDEQSIRTALSEVIDGKETLPLYYASQARSRADWLIGMNFTRAFTLISQQANVRGVFSVGRVQTPVVKLVYDRDQSIKDFTPSPFYVLSATFEVQNGLLEAAWRPPEQVSDEQGRCVNKVICEQFRDALPGRSAEIVKADVKLGKESPPLPFSLSRLQQHCSKKFGMSAKSVLTHAQSLYEKHKATTYPRSDCGYLPLSQHAEAPDVLRAMALSDPESQGMVSGADISIRSRAFNDKKLSAHHGIIPTAASINVSAMSADEYKVYCEIRRHYVSQFYARHEFERTEIEVKCADQIFDAKGKVPIKSGWKVLYGQDESDEEKPSSNNNEGHAESNNPLPKVREGEPARCAGAEIIQKMTRPPTHFSDATLIGAMENISRFVDDNELKKILRSTAGLGTEATRADVIDNCIHKEYLVRNKGVITSTDKAAALLALVPKDVASPAMTAAWEQKLELIAAGDERMEPFVDEIGKWATGIVGDMRANSNSILAEAKDRLAAIAERTEPCPTCKGDMIRLYSKAKKKTETSPARKASYFWACQNKECRRTLSDDKGKPVMGLGKKSTSKATGRKSNNQVDRKKESNGKECPECGKGMILRTSKKKNSSEFWGCTGFPECKKTLQA